MNVTMADMERVFCISAGEGMGTAFTLEYSNRQYLVTAKHLFNKANYPIVHSIYFLGYDQGKELHNADIWYHPADEVDVAVLPLMKDVSPRQNNPFGINYASGDEVLFYGYPHCLSTNALSVNISKPLPMAKRAMVAGFHSKYITVLDGLGNPGFSGGPVYLPITNSEGNLSEYKEIIGIISGGFIDTGLIMMSTIDAAYEIIVENTQNRSS